MKILIISGIYPPDIGGPAQYAKNLEDVWQKNGFDAKTLYYKFEKKLPTIIRHIYFFFRMLAHIRGVDFILALDTFSVGFPGVIISKIFRKPIYMRIGGDFLWESYVERTGHLILLRNFYEDTKVNLNLKEKIIFKITKWVIQHTTRLIFSTNWQKDIWLKPYGLNLLKVTVVENYFGEKITSFDFKEKKFIGGTRPLKWKNLSLLKEAFSRDEIVSRKIILDDSTTSHQKFIEKIQNCYAVILVSLGDISPNMILDAIRCDKPFILTRESGLYEKLKDVAVFVDPESIGDVVEKILFLADEVNYKEAVLKVKNFKFTHSWDDIAREIVAIHHK